MGPPGPVQEILETVPVSGVVTYQGKPLDSFMVTFYPADGRRPATGKTDAGGKFTLGTNTPGDGAVVGTHNVTIVWNAPEVDSAAGGSPIDNPALMPKPSIKIPSKYADATKSGLSQEIPDDGKSDIKIEL